MNIHYDTTNLPSFDFDSFLVHIVLLSISIVPLYELICAKFDRESKGM